jgi:hypothetical protein
MRIVCVGDTHSRFVNACVCDAAYRSINPLAAIPDAVQPYRVQSSRLSLLSTGTARKSIKDLTAQRKQVYTGSLAPADMRKARGRTWRLVSKDRTIGTVRGEGTAAAWSPRAGEFAGAGSLVRPGTLSICAFTCGERLQGQEGGESLASGRMRHNRI